MRTRPAFPVLLLLGLMLAAAPARAQYMYLDSNGNGIHDPGDNLGSTGTPTTVDVYLNTNHNRDASTATCDTGDGDLTINSYVLNLAASNGTVTFSSFINRQSGFTVHFGEHNPGTGTYGNGYGGFGPLPPGLYRLATVTITSTSGTPVVDIVDGIPDSLDRTSFGTQCSGNDFDNTYKLAGPAGGTDWTDADGLGGGGCSFSCPPFLGPVADMTVNEGATVTQGLTATDPDGNPVTFQKVSGPLYMTVSTLSPGPGTATGQITLSPGFSDAGSGVQASVRAVDGVLVSNTRNFSITVNNVNRQPISNPGGPYSGVPGVPIAFDGTGSADPDGSPLTYFWNFGDGTANGSTPAHTYSAAGVYPVSLVVSDGSLSGTASTTATITEIFQARAFTTKSNRIVRLGSGKSIWSAQLEPVAGSFDVANVDLSSVRMKSQGTGSVSEIPAQFGKAAISNDSDGNGVMEITASFGKDDLQLLFANVTGQTSVPVTFTGSVTTGGSFQTQMDVNVKASGGPVASAYPNPFHPFGWVSVNVPMPGKLEVKVFDANGRLVRRIEDAGTVTSGYRRIAIDGADDHGSPLPSGIYFLKIETAAGPITTRVAIVR